MSGADVARRQGIDAAASADAAAPMLVEGAGVAPQRWRNGGGWTRELLAWPEAADWQVRISVADVESDGPFSAFADVQRWFTVLEGGGVELVVDGATHRMTASSPALAFDGAATTRARLIDGLTRDLNLMLRGIDGRLHAATVGVAWRPARRSAGLYAGVPLRCRHDGTDTDVPAGALLWFATAPQSLAVGLSAPRPDGARIDDAAAWPSSASPSSSSSPLSARASDAPAAWWIEAGALAA